MERRRKNLLFTAKCHRVVPYLAEKVRRERGTNYTSLHKYSRSPAVLPSCPKIQSRTASKWLLRVGWCAGCWILDAVFQILSTDVDWKHTDACKDHLWSKDRVVAPCRTRFLPVKLENQGFPGPLVCPPCRDAAWFRVCVTFNPQLWLLCGHNNPQSAVFLIFWCLSDFFFFFFSWRINSLDFLRTLSECALDIGTFCSDWAHCIIV